MTPDQLQEHATDAVLFAIRHIGRHGGLREALTSSTKYPDPASQAEADMDVGMIAALIRTAKITVTWDDEPTPELPAWLIGAADQLVDDLGHPAPGSLTALVASAYRAGQQVRPAQPDVYLHGDSGYLWLTCNRCDDPLMEAQAGDNLADFNAKAAAHQATCAATQPVQEAQQ